MTIQETKKETCHDVHPKRGKHVTASNLCIIVFILLHGFPVCWSMGCATLTGNEIQARCEAYCTEHVHDSVALVLGSRDWGVTADEQREFLRATFGEVSMQPRIQTIDNDFKTLDQGVQGMEAGLVSLYEDSKITESLFHREVQKQAQKQAQNVRAFSKCAIGTGSCGSFGKCTAESTQCENLHSFIKDEYKKAGIVPAEVLTSTQKAMDGSENLLKLTRDTFQRAVLPLRNRLNTYARKLKGAGLIAKDQDLICRKTFEKDIMCYCVAPPVDAIGVKAKSCEWENYAVGSTCKADSQCQSSSCKSGRCCFQDDANCLKCGQNGKCAECRAGTYLDAYSGVCVQCPNGKWSQKGARSEGECTELSYCGDKTPILDRCENYCGKGSIPLQLGGYAYVLNNDTKSRLVEGYSYSPAQDIDLNEYSKKVVRVRQKITEVKEAYNLLAERTKRMQEFVNKEWPISQKMFKEQATDGSPRDQLMNEVAIQMKFILNQKDCGSNKDVVLTQKLWKDTGIKIALLIEEFKHLLDIAEKIEHNIRIRARTLETFVITKPISPICNLEGGETASCVCLGSPIKPTLLRSNTCHIHNEGESCFLQQTCHEGSTCIDSKCTAPSPAPFHQKTQLRAIKSSGSDAQENQAAASSNSASRSFNPFMILAVVITNMMMM